MAGATGAPTSGGGGREGGGGGGGGGESYLVCLFCITAGQNGENLGSDEQQIVEIVYLLYDVINNKVVLVQQHYVRPVSDDSAETVQLTSECKALTGLVDDDIRNVQSLEQVLDEFDRFLRAKEIHPDHGGKPFCLCTDGSLHLRMSIHPEAFRKNITLPPYFYRYYDLRKRFKIFYKTDKSIGSIADMLDFLGLESDVSTEYGTRQCQNMGMIISRLLTDGHQFIQPEIIIDKLETGICEKNDAIDDETIVKARGLPWQSSDQDIFNFFRGLNVARGGVAVCLSQLGRRNGEALVRFETREHRGLALRKHKHHLGQRYVEVYRAAGKDFLLVAGGNSREAQTFLTRHGGNNTRVIVRMRGLPYSSKAEHVLEFFRSGSPSVEVLDGEDGILFVHQADGRATGDAFVLFPSEDVAALALHKHKQLIGSRYIELFKSTTAEVQQVLNRSLDPRNPSFEHLRDAHALQAMVAGMPPLPLQLIPQRLVVNGTRRDCIRLRGLPAETTVNDIVTFLDKFSKEIAVQGVHLIYNAEGTPSGDAFIQMNSEGAAEGATLAKNRKYLYANNKRRNIEVIQCSGENMNSLLGAGTMPQLVLSPQGTVRPSLPSLPLPPASTASLRQQSAAMMWPTAGTALSQYQQVVPGNLMTSNTPTGVTLLPQLLTLPPSSNQVPGGGGAQTPLFPYVTNISSQQVLHHPPSSILSPPSTHPHTTSSLSFPSQIIALPQLTHQPTVSMAGGTQNMVAAQHLSPFGTLAGTLTGGHAPYGALQPRVGSCLTPNSNINISGGLTAASSPYTMIQPVFYWYPSPPVSPQGAYYMPPAPVSITVKGLPPATQANDILAFLDGLYDIQPDVQLLFDAEGRSTGSAVVTFATRTEAERAVTERHRKMLGNKLIELRAD